jgi:two-component system, response regulator PdtaR
MDGIELARYVRERRPPTIIVVSSGKVVPQPGTLGEDVSFLAKPYNDAKLDSVIADIRSKLCPATGL